MTVPRSNAARCVLATLVMALCCGCTQPSQKPLTLATTTSTRDSGLLDVLVPLFENSTGIAVKVVAVGSGQALELGLRGDADVLLTHSPDAEKTFVIEGHGEKRIPVMTNDFVVIGPKADPAMLQGTSNAVEAFARLAESRVPFVSRGDESGTHSKEKALWQAAHRESHGDWYIEAGTGMAETLRIADEKDAYTLSDRSTYLAQKERLGLVIAAEGDPLLKNEYSVIVVSHDKHPRVNHSAAQRFADFLQSAEARRTIAEFGTDQFGQPLFFVEP